MLLPQSDDAKGRRNQVVISRNQVVIKWSSSPASPNRIEKRTSSAIREMQSGRCDPGDAITCVSPPRQKRERCLDAYLLRDAIREMQSGRCNQGDAIREMQSGRCNPGGAREPSPSAVDGLSLHWPAPRHRVRGGRIGINEVRQAAESASMRFVKRPNRYQ